ncbi:hypothetical protein BCV69DRAFT_283933 [Microstroma glucosiphilum]|uniref:DUF300-domain-containing protein n=1 Tax=Pseudomicrostroma glucosiphilum TaxID=1684307 RepID=A0A316U4S2_9BASI|nr:hypothetical protein BCV69DRAFT_283933 [Pseudomicrostroma glucosiphilum]PWN19828.1 hypothetical protein BCV69DRAFT_283933 [Pseudomicrostroma glucosiphilum]
MWYPQSSAFDVISACYEALVVVSFFTLLLQYLGDTFAQQEDVFRKVRLLQGPFPGGWWETRTKSGLGFLRFMKVAILQYAICLPICTVVAIPLRSVHWDCEESWLPGVINTWLSITLHSSSIVVMYCLVVFYCTIADRIKSHGALLKLVSVLATMVLCFLPGKVVTNNWIELQAELDRVFSAVRMALIALLHLKAFSYSAYRAHDQAKTSRWRAALDAINCRDLSAQMEDFRRIVTRDDREHGYIVLDDVSTETSQPQATARSWTDMPEETA